MSVIASQNTNIAKAPDAQFSRARASLPKIKQLNPIAKNHIKSADVEADELFRSRLNSMSCLRKKLSP